MIENGIIDFDKVLYFTLKNSSIRGRFVKLDKAINSILKRHDYTLPVSLCLADALSSCCCIGSLLKFNGYFTIQASGKEKLKTMLADYSNNGEIRGYVNYDKNALNGIKKDASIDQLMHDGHLAFTAIESKSNKRYQGIIPVQKGSFSKCIDYYFKKSEQTNSEIICFSELSNKTYISSAILIQATPEELNDTSENQLNLFEEASLFLKSLNKSEVLSRQISMENILYKLFHSFEVRVQKEITIKDNCRCSLDRVKKTLLNISNAELDELTFSDGRLEVICEFCKNLTKFSRQDLFSIRKSINS